MPLQSRDLSMIGLGSRGNASPNTLQPALADGIHLRWSFDRSLGFPWYGFFLFRRLHRQGDWLCLSQYQAGTSDASIQPTAARAVALTPATRMRTPLGYLSSDRAITVSDDFSPSGVWELDLDHRDYLRFDFPPDEPARRIAVKVGFRTEDGGGRGDLKCLSFLDRPPDKGPNPRVEHGVRFRVYDHEGNPKPRSHIDAWGGYSGLNCGYTLEITLPVPIPVVETVLSHFNDRPVVEAFEEDGGSAGTAKFTGAEGALQRLRLQGRALRRIVVRAPGNEALLHELCVGKREDQGDPRRLEPIRITALADDAPVAEEWIKGHPGQIVTASLAADSISAVTFTSGTAVLVDLCLVPVFQGIEKGWEPVPDVPQPLCLPVTHPDYPCPGKPPTQARAEDMAASRVSYGDPGQWRGAPFEQLHEQLKTLVVSGPPPSGRPMALRSRTFDDGPKLKEQRTLDWVMLASLQPAIAQMLGLYWLDRTVDSAQSYDYLLVSDYLDRFHGKADNVLRWLYAHGGAGIDGYIVFNKRMAPAPPLAPPKDLRAYALPGSTVKTPTGLEDATNNVGLRWETSVTDRGILLPNKPVVYNLWRADLEVAAPADPPADGDYQLVTKQPILVAQSQVAPEASVEGASDWPPFPTHAMDSRLPDGWYSYELSGVDIFGRHSANSAPGAWFQWIPTPDPRPWYYQDPPGNRAIHDFAIQVLDKVAPPPPTGIEAFALDPKDPFLQRDATYNAWFNDTLSAAEQESLVGLRLR